MEKHFLLTALLELEPHLFVQLPLILQLKSSDSVEP